MELRIDLTGRTVLVAGPDRGAERAVRRYRAARALVRTVGSPSALTPGTLQGVHLVALVDDARAGWGALEQACRDHGVLLTREEPAAGGRVTLVGGGPGSTGLLTLEAVAALREADVVLHDRLGPSADLRELAPGAELIDVGKRPGHHRVTQRGTEELMTALARAGRSVVRLKGGDPFVFGRGGEEVAACVAAGVPCRVVPGVTSAISVPAAAGIPVTHRGVSRMFTVVSGHAPLTEDEHRHLAGLGGTVVVLMGVGTLPHLTAGLRAAGMGADTPVAVVERGWSPTQRTTAGTLATIAADAQSAGCESPAVLVVGEVVRTGRALQGGLARLAELDHAPA